MELLDRSLSRSSEIHHIFIGDPDKIYTY